MLRQILIFRQCWGSDAYKINAYKKQGLDSPPIPDITDLNEFSEISDEYSELQIYHNIKDLVFYKCR